MSVHTAACLFTMLFSTPPNHAVVLSLLSGAWHCLKLLDNYLPQPTLNHACCHCLAGFRGGGGLEGHVFLHCLNTQFLIVTLNRAMGYNMLYSRFQVDQRKCLFLTEGTGYSGTVEPANFLYIVHLHFLLSSIILISFEAVMCSNRRIYFSVVVNCGLMAKTGFPGGAPVKYPPDNAGAIRDVGSISGSERFPWSRKWQPTPVFLPEKFHGQKSLVGYSPWSCKSQTQLSTAVLFV